MPTGTRFRPKQFEASDLGVQPVMWWDASDESTVTLNGIKVSQVDDKSGNNFHLSQASEADQPEYISTVNQSELLQKLNNRNFLYFENNTVGMWSSNINTANLSGECTIFISMYNDNLSLDTKAIRSAPSTSSNGIVARINGSTASNDLSWQYGNTTSGILQTDYTGGNSSNVYCLRYSVVEQAQKVWQNNYVVMSDSDAATFTSNNHQMVIGDDFTGGIGEVIIYNQALTEYQIDQINRQLMVKWTGLQVKEDLEVWYDASRPDTITLNGSNVSQWDDISSNGNHLTQTNGSEQPIYDSSTNYIEFDSNSKELDFTTPSTPTSGTILAVLEITDTGLVRHAFIDGNSKSIRAEQNNNTGRLGYTYLGVGDYKGSTYLQFDVKALYGWQIQSPTICRTRFNASEWDEFGITGGELPLSIVGGGDGFR